MPDLSYAANPSIGIRTAELLFANTANPLMRLQYVDISKDATDPLPFARITIDADASSASHFIMYLDIGASATDYTQYQFADGTVQVDPNGVDAAPTFAVITDLASLLAALNAIDGVVAHRLHAAADHSMATDDFVDMATTRVGPLWVDAVYKDTAAVTSLNAGLRIGVPENANGAIGRGRLELIRIQSNVDSDSGTDCTFQISYDPTELDEGDEVVLPYTRLVPDATITDLYDFHTAPPVHQGPLLVEITAAAGPIAQNSWVRVAYRNVEL